MHEPRFDVAMLSFMTYYIAEMMAFLSYLHMHMKV